MSKEQWEAFKLVCIALMVDTKCYCETEQVNDQAYVINPCPNCRALKALDNIHVIEKAAYNELEEIRKRNLNNLIFWREKAITLRTKVNELKEANHCLDIECKSLQQLVLEKQDIIDKLKWGSE